MKDKKLETYCDEIESFFFRWKGRTGNLSPGDFRRVEQWYRERIPLEAVLEGISTAFRMQRAGRNAGVEEVNSLSFCESFVRRTADQHNEPP
jgi:hypothetical protein